MSKNSLQEKLDALKSVLHKMSQQPADDADLKVASQYINEIDHDLHLSEDQIRLAALYRVSQALGATLDLDQVLTQVMDAVIGLTKAERGFLVLLEDGSKEWKLRAARNFERETLQQKDLEVSGTVINTVLESDQGLVTTDAQSDPRFSERESVVFYALRSIMCAPLRSRGRVIGAIYVDNRAQAGLFRKTDLEMLNTLAAQAAVAIENARLYTRTDQALALRVAELETLAKVDRELNNQLDLHLVMEIAYRWVSQQAKATQCWIVLAENGNLDGELSAYPAELPDLKKECVVQALTERVTKVAAPDEENPACLVLPILYTGKSQGVVIVHRPDAFADSEIQFLAHLVDHSSTAIQNARFYRAVQQMSEAKSQFISVVTHELRVPMTSIKGYADLLRQGAIGPVNDMQLNFLDVIRNNVERMSVLVSDLSDISKIESGHIKLVCSSIPLKVYVDETLRALRPKLQEKEQRLDVAVGSDLMVYADYNRLIQILTNLVSNASKYTAAGGKISVSASPQGKVIRVEVIDNGIGIAPQDHVKIFGQFFRSEDAAVRSEQGWGLGLSIAKRLVELMGGSIGFVSALGEGSTFWFTLPIEERSS